MPPSSPDTRSWKKSLRGLASVLLLVPVPLYAATDLTWSSWTESDNYGNPGHAWSVGSGSGQVGGTSNDYLFAVAKSMGPPITAVTFSYSATITQRAGVSDTITPSISGLNNLTLTAGTVSWQVSVNPVGTSNYSYLYPNPPTNNQFSGSAGGTSGPSATQTGTGLTLTNSGTGTVQYNVQVSFAFTSNPNWTAQTVSSSSVTVFFNSVSN